MLGPNLVGEFVSSARAIQYLESSGFQVLCGREVINENYIRGAKPVEIEEGLKFARERGVSEELLARMNGVTGVVVFLIQVVQVRLSASGVN